MSIKFHHKAALAVLTRFSPNTPTTDLHFSSACNILNLKTLTAAKLFANTRNCPAEFSHLLQNTQCEIKHQKGIYLLIYLFI
jgi:hypothetical protein